MSWIMVAETHWQQQCSRHGEVLATTQVWDPPSTASRETEIGPSWEAAVAVEQVVAKPLGPDVRPSRVSQGAS